MGGGHSNQFEFDSTYSIIIGRQTLRLIETYVDNLKTGSMEPGKYLGEKLESSATSLQDLGARQLLELLVQTKKACIFAETAVAGNGSDWNLTELSLLGGVNVAVPVVIFDNGIHRGAGIVPHEKPFRGILLYTPGALLRTGGLGGRGTPPVDWNECIQENEDDDAMGVPEIDMNGYYRLYERRLLPLLLYADSIGRDAGRGVILTVPGLGCGQFAGPFLKQLGERFGEVLKRLLNEHGENLGFVKVVYYDPYDECENETTEIHGIRLMVRPLRKGNQERPQLCHPSQYAEKGDNFSKLILFSMVAWDHVSFPETTFLEEVEELMMGSKRQQQIR